MKQKERETLTQLSYFGNNSFRDIDRLAGIYVSANYLKRRAQFFLPFNFIS